MITKQSRKCSVKRLRFEALETRQMLAVGAWVGVPLKPTMPVILPTVIAKPAPLPTIAVSPAQVQPAFVPVVPSFAAATSSPSVQDMLAQIAALQAQLAAMQSSPPAPVLAPGMNVINNTVPTLDILPGAQNKLLADMTLAVGGRQYDRLTEMMFVSALGSDLLAQDAGNFTLKADLNNKAGDGCEAVIGGGFANWATDTLDIIVSTPVWIRPGQNLHVQVYANFSTWLSGDTFGVELAQASFNDLRNQAVPDGNVTYSGVAPVLHTMENAIVWINQQQMLPYGSAYAGDKGVNLLKANMGGNNAIMDTLSFVASAGNLLSDGANYTLSFDKSYDGSYSGVSFIGTVTGDRLVFNFGSTGGLGNGEFKVTADIAAAPLDKSFQLRFPGDGSGTTGHNAINGKALQGMQVSGPNMAYGQFGQISIYESTDWGTAYNIVTKPEELVVKEFGSTENQWDNIKQALAGDNIIVDTGSMYAPVSDLTITHMAICAVNGTNLSSVKNYTLWVDPDGNEPTFSYIKLCTGTVVGNQVYFDSGTFGLGSGGKTVNWQIRADVPDPLPNNSLQVQLAGTQGVTAKKKDNTLLAVDKIFLQDAWQTYWNLGSGGMG